MLKLDVILGVCRRFRVNEMCVKALCFQSVVGENEIRVAL